jgi:hypothetical protein
MAKETLSVPEEYLLDVIAVIRAGLKEVDVPAEVYRNLSLWCDEEEDYITGGDDE